MTGRTWYALIAAAICQRHDELRQTSGSSLVYYDIATGESVDHKSDRTLALSTSMCYNPHEVYMMIQEHPYTKSLAPSVAAAV
jgi:fibrillarin-like rRNA methylase